MPAKRYRVTLRPEERQELEKLVSTGRRAAQTLTQARILLQADEAQGIRRSDAEICESLGVNHATVERTRQALVEEGRSAALYRKPRSRPGHVKFEGQKEAQLLAGACSPAPEGRQRWTLQLLADKLVEWHVFESISPETVRQVLKKTNSSRG
jgi:Homeodomain-like domain